MNFQHINVKIFVERELPVAMEPFIGVFHRWVAEQAMEHVLIDVADYRHIHDGPGVVLVGLEVDYSLDQTGGRHGLRFNQKGPVEGTDLDRVAHSYAQAAEACTRLESAMPGLKFDRGDYRVWINDRALAANTPEVRAAFREALDSFVATQAGSQDATIELCEDPRQLVSAHVRH